MLDVKHKSVNTIFEMTWRIIELSLPALQANLIETYVQELLKIPYIEVEHQGELHKILVTKPRTKSTSQTEDPCSSNTFAESDFAQSDEIESDEYNNQQSVFCTRIPHQIYNGRDLRFHFKRFGVVHKIYFPPNSKTNAIVYFRDHDAAVRAIRSGGKMDHGLGRIVIKWNRDERPRHLRNNVEFSVAFSHGSRARRDTKSQTFSGTQFQRESESEAKAILSLIPNNWNQILDKEKDFFVEPLKRCVLIRNLPAHISGERLCSYFENLGHCGGRVVSLKRIIDGILVEFEDEDTADSVCINDHEIDNISVQVLPKTIPTIYEDCFIVEGNFENMVTLKLWLECGFSSNDFTLECHSENAIYLLKFFMPVEFQELLSFVKRVPLEKIQPKIRELTRPDCIIVKGLGANVSNDIIKFTFMKRSVTGGAQVTMIKRKPGTSSAFVYFSDWQDAANLVEQSNRVVIGGKEVEICLWYNHVTRVSDIRKSENIPSKPVSKATDRIPLRPFEHDFESDVIEFIRYSSTHLNDIKRDLENLAVINFPYQRKSVVRFMPNFKKVNPGMKQTKFEEECLRRFDHLLALKFTTQSKAFNSNNLSQVRRSHMWSESFGLIRIETDENSKPIQVFVKWGFPPKGVTKVTGLVHHVPEVMKWLTKKCDITKKIVPFSAEELRIVTEFDIIDDLKEHVCNDDIRVSLDKTSTSVSLEGPFNAVTKANDYLKKCLQNVGTSIFPFLGQQQADFLRNVYDQSATNDNNRQIIEKIQRLFQSRKVKDFFNDQPNVVLVYYRRIDLNIATQILTEFIIKKEIEIKRDFDGITLSQDWKRLEQNLDQQLKGGVLLLKDKRSSKLILVGTKSSVDSAYKTITDHIKYEIVETKIINMDIFSSLFLHYFPDQLQASVHLAGVEWRLRLNGENEVVLKGKHQEITKAEVWLNDVKSLLKRKTISISDHGMVHYFGSAKGKEFLSTTQTLTKCLLFNISTTYETSPSASTTSSSQSKATSSSSPSGASSMPSKLSSTLPITSSVQIPSTSSSSSIQTPARHRTASVDPALITLRLGDISEMSVDVIVTSCAPNTFHSCAGSVTSRALLAKAGRGLQKACQQQAKQELTGFDIKQTAGYKLKCKEVFHVLLQKNDGTNHAKFIASIQQCLLIAEQKGYKSIAFPAIGTGGMGYSYKDLAKWFKLLFVKFDGTHLKNIEIVLNPADTDAISVFSSTFGVKSSSFPISVRASKKTKPKVQNPSPASCTVEVKQGDIFSTTCQMIVCPTAKNYELSRGKLSKKLLVKAGQGVDLQCQIDPLYKGNSDEYRITDGGYLSCKRIAFVPPPSHANKISDTLGQIFYIADCYGMRSIALPALFTGNVGFSSHVVACQIANAIKWYIDTGMTTLNRIEVMILESAKLPVFQIAVEKIKSKPVSFDSALKDSKSTTVKKIPASIIPLQGSAGYPNVKLRLHSSRNKNIEQAEKRIRKEVEERSLTKTIENDVIALLTNYEENDVLNLEKKHNVVLYRNNERTKITISGLKDDVYKASEALAEILQEFQAALICAEYVIWKFKDPSSTELIDFKLGTSAKLEKCYKKDENSSVNLEVSLSSGRVKCTLNFRTMIASSFEYQIQIVRSIIINDAFSDDLPSYWTAMDNEQLKLVPLPTDSDEYKKNFQKFSIFGSKLFSFFTSYAVQIERIQNPTLHKQFMAQKRKVKARMQQRGVQGPVTRALFHGTSADVCDHICKDGFDRSHCGKNATAYGKGVYFATTANYSQGYARSDSQGRRRMFLAEVITGEYCNGNSSYKVPPLFPGSDSQRYDSVVDNVQQPSIFVVFKDASVYPLYIATYV